MTIIQHFAGKKLSKQEEPLVPTETTENGKDVEEGRPVVVTMHAVRVQRVCSMTTVCVFITALLVLTTGVIGGVYLYRQFAHYKMRETQKINDNLSRVSPSQQELRHFKGWCSIPFPEESDAPKYEALQEGAILPPTRETESKERLSMKYFDEKVVIDIKEEQFETISVPSFAHGRKAHFIHDFVLDKTGIVDTENRRCFVMILNRSLIFPPHLFYEQVSKMRAGYYDTDIQVVRHIMQVVLPPVTDLKNVGFFIARDCSSYPIYVLERASMPVHKRSIETDQKDFIEYAGKKISVIKIVNLDQAVPGEKS